MERLQIYNFKLKNKNVNLNKSRRGGSPAECVDAPGAGGFGPWDEPKTRALAAACFHQVTKVNQSALNFSMHPRKRAKNHEHGRDKGREEGEGPGRGRNDSRTRAGRAFFTDFYLIF